MEIMAKAKVRFRSELGDLKILKIPSPGISSTKLQKIIKRNKVPARGKICLVLASLPVMELKKL
jgi:hypothetical protein